jgi:hypothetical protein
MGGPDRRGTLPGRYHLATWRADLTVLVSSPNEGRKRGALFKNCRPTFCPRLLALWQYVPPLPLPFPLCREAWEGTVRPVVVSHKSHRTTNGAKLAPKPRPRHEQQTA